MWPATGKHRLERNALRIQLGYQHFGGTTEQTELLLADK